MLAFRLRLRFTTAEVDEAAGALRSLAGPVRAEPGCLATRLMRDANDPQTLAYVEEWRDLEDFDRHLRTAWFRTILAVMELAAGEPVVEIDDIHSRRGFDRIEELLENGHADLAVEGRPGATT